VAPRAGCELADEEKRESYARTAASGRFLLGCGATQALLAVPADRVAPLPMGAFATTWLAVGALYVEGRTGPEACGKAAGELRHGRFCIALYDIATGAVSYRPESQVPDIDRVGAPTVCTLLRKPFVAEVPAPRFAYGLGYLAMSAGAAGAVALERCDCQRRVLRASGDPENFDLRGGLLSWDSGHLGGEPPEPGEARSGTLWTYQLSSERRRHWTLPRVTLVGEAPVPGVPEVLGYSTHTARAVFWIATRSIIRSASPEVQVTSVGTSTVYAAALH
jgi:hypothetical protein